MKLGYGRLLCLLFLFLTGTGHIRSQEYIPSGAGIKVKHAFYSLGFDTIHRQANWVYYELKSRGNRAVGRENDFRVDPQLNLFSATPDDYKRSGYDRGHLCPAADMAFDKKAMSETFYMSNMSPQVPAFNRGIWKRLEDLLRKRGRKELLYVVTGPVFKENKGHIGKNKVTVPGYYYKLFYAPASQQMIAYLLPNAGSDQPLKDFAVSVDRIEALTGIDFFPQLPDEIEKLLEADTAAHPELVSGLKRGGKPGKREQAVLVVVTVVLFVALQFFIRKKGRKRKGRRKKKKR
ncbi:DNA/RNA non-specific endonuclease [Gabonibacter massiliensis]|uniref:DNA/RNA non-specific endonuclease n=1 Tax=Gabonibacter massiliensis TaxID=1720195 RepID=UPI002570B0B2|nr:DNA/RNA non-specific endonuclease [Gabonibacter massiliensis]